MNGVWEYPRSTLKIRGLYIIFFDLHVLQSSDVHLTTTFHNLTLLLLSLILSTANTVTKVSVTRDTYVKQCLHYTP